MVLPPKAGIYEHGAAHRDNLLGARSRRPRGATDGRTGITTFRGSKVFEAQALTSPPQFIDPPHAHA